METNIGFNDQTFLTKEEWQTYIKRMPVRYIRKEKEELCEICGKPESKDNKFNLSHKIGFYLGILNFGLTPDFVDRDENIITAHRKFCNREAEMTIQDVCKRLVDLGIGKLPDFLPSETFEAWGKTRQQKRKHE